MGLVAPLFGFGLGILGFGLFWSLIDDSLTHLDAFILNNEYYLLSDLIWHALPILCIVIGVLCLVAGGLASRGTRRVIYE